MLATPETLMEAVVLQRLAESLPSQLRRVPLYRQNGAMAALNGDAFSAETYRRLPFITKSDIRRDFPRNFLEIERDLEDLLERELVEVEHTSGTGEARTPLLLGQGWWAEQEERALRLNPFVNGVLDEVPGARRVNITSPVCSGDICYTGVPSRSERVVGNALFLSLTRLPFLWSENDLARMAREAIDWAPTFLDVDPAYAVVFALHCERRGIRLPSLRFIVCTYEFVSVTHRQVLERVFQVPVFNLYGSTETGHLLMQTERGLMRASLETAFLEVLEPDARGIGELAVTTLTNEFMPLIRYKIGDLVETRRDPYRTRHVVHGRAADAFSRTGNSNKVTVWQIDQAFANLPGFAHYQLCQTGPDSFKLRFVPDSPAPATETIAELRQRLEVTLAGGASVTVEPVEFLMPENSGKFRLCYPSS